MDTREKLLIYGLKAYSIHGLDKTTIDDILNESTSKKGSFYHFFSSKDELLEESLTRYFFPIIEKRLEQFKNSAKPFRETVESFYLNMQEETHQMLRENTGIADISSQDIGLLMLEGIRKQRFANGIFYINQRQIRDAMIEKVVREQQANRLPRQLESSEIATLLIAAGEGALYLSSWNTSLYTNQDVLQVMFRHIWSYLGGEPLNTTTPLLQLSQFD